MSIFNLETYDEVVSFEHGKLRIGLYNYSWGWCHLDKEQTKALYEAMKEYYEKDESDD